MRHIAVLDACVLFSKTLADALLYPAAVGAFMPRWSPSIREEWVRNLHQHLVERGKPPSAAAARAQAMDRAFPEACIGQRLMEECLSAATTLCDAGGLHPDDAHVMAAAMASGADVLVTMNTRHFPDRVVWRDRVIVRVSADAFLTRLLEEIPDVVLEGYRRQRPDGTPTLRHLEEIAGRLAAPQMVPHAATLLKRLIARGAG